MWTYNKVDSIPNGFQQHWSELGRRIGKETLTRMWLDILNEQAQSQVKTESKLSKISFSIRKALNLNLGNEI